MKYLFLSMIFISSITSTLANCNITDNERWPHENFPTWMVEKESIKPIAECGVILKDSNIRDGGVTTTVRKGCIYRAKTSDNKEAIGVIVSGANGEGQFTIADNKVFSSFSENSNKIKIAHKVSDFRTSNPDYSYDFNDSYVFDKNRLELELKSKMKVKLNGKFSESITQFDLKLGCKAIN